MGCDRVAKTFIILVCLLAGFVNSQQCPSSSRASRMTQLYSCDFEVFGIVQGVFFRKHTQKRATELGVKGWCMNTRNDTVKGVMEGEEKPINEMKYWLQNVGSPSSKIDKAVFGALKPIEAYSYPNFGVKR